MIEVVLKLNNRMGKKVRVKWNEDDTISDLKKLVAAQTGTRHDNICIQKWYTIYKDYITLNDFHIHDGMEPNLYCVYPLSLTCALALYFSHECMFHDSYNRLLIPCLLSLELGK
ncbi:hypothetical protein Fmac_019615 [Flemingia macrophylla]|uniref:Ubiquitin-like protein 5 n=1 Tax=Flemingia macrophylla TaxID=520843 RepID=A0ABD1M8A8_9FABA